MTLATLATALLVSMAALSLACESGPVETGANPPPPPTQTPSGLRYGTPGSIHVLSGEASEEDAERMREQSEESEKSDE